MDPPPLIPSPPHQPLSTNPASPKMTDQERSTHLHFMRAALSMASLALSTSETPVGCVLVYQNTIIGRGMNATNATYNGTRHAEFIAINDVLTSGKYSRMEGVEVLKECSLYVTVEPCIMCASLLRQFGIKRVFFGAGNEKFGGCGGVLNIHSGNGVVERGDGLRDGEGEEGKEVSDREEEGEMRERQEGDFEVSGGWLREEAILLLREFYVQENGRAPEPRRRGKEQRVLNVDVEPLGAGVSGG